MDIGVHGDANREESGSFDGDAASEFGIGCLHIDYASLPGGTNPFNNQHLRVKNNDATAKTREAVPDPTSSGAKNTVPLDMGGENPVLAELHTDRFTLENWKCCLDSCATYHTLFSVNY